MQAKILELQSEILHKYFDFEFYTTVVSIQVCLLKCIKK